MTLTAFNRHRREQARRQAIVIATPAPVEPTPPTAEELAAAAVAEYVKHVGKLNKPDLVAMATERGIDPAGLTKPQLVEALVTIGPAQEPANESGDESGDQSPEPTQESE